MKKLILFLSMWGIGLYAQEQASYFEETGSKADSQDQTSYLAQNKPKVKQNSPNCIEVFFSHLQVGANYTYVSMTPQGNPSFTGNLGGIQGQYEFRARNRIYGGLKLAWREGSTSNTTGNRSFLDCDIQERIGYTFGDQSQKYMLSLYSGFGFRYLGEKFRPTTGSSINFKYQEFYVPVGLYSDYQFTDVFNLGLYFTWMPQVYPTVTIVPLSGARWILTNSLKNFLAELPFTFTFPQNKHVSVVLKPFFEYWQDGSTTAKTSAGVSLGLPRNTYYFGGIDVNLEYSF